MELRVHEHATTQGDHPPVRFPSIWRCMEGRHQASFVLYTGDDSDKENYTASCAKSAEALQVVGVLHAAFKYMWKKYAPNTLLTRTRIMSQVPTTASENSLVGGVGGAGHPFAVRNTGPHMSSLFQVRNTASGDIPAPHDDGGRVLLVGIVRELEAINVRIMGVEMLQNTKSVVMNHAWCTHQGVPLEDYKILYHGTTERALRSIRAEGVCTRYCKANGSDGPGVYVTDFFEKALSLSMEKKDHDECVVVLVLRCHLGKIKEVSRDDTRDFVGIDGDVYNCKHSPSSKHHVIAEDSQIICQYALKIQVVDTKRVPVQQKPQQKKRPRSDAD